MEILTLKNLSFTYPTEEKKAVDNVSLFVKEGEFICLCGSSACGKTTLMRLIKRELAPRGTLSGEIFFCGKAQSELSERESASEIGYVLQNPETQIVTDKVWHELSFGLENLGYSSDIIRLRIGEMANYFGISHMFRSSTAELSGGQKQLLSLAAIMAMSPKLLLLDEPTSQLDPIAAADFIATLKKINRELGTTIIIAEHRLEDIFPIADKIAVMENGALIAFDTPKNVCRKLKDHRACLGFPVSARIWQALSGEGEVPLTVREGRTFFKENFSPRKNDLKTEEEKRETALSFSDVYFRYEKNAPDVLRGVNTTINRSEIFCLLGANGAGKSTVLRAAAGLIKPYRGKIKTAEGAKTALLCQNVQDLFLMNTVKEDLMDILSVYGIKKGEANTKIEEISKMIGISHLLEKHPYDVSGGEAQKCALAKVLLTEPDILLLDEPTKALDPAAKKELAVILRALCKKGVTIFIVTHDVEFAAENADRCALFFDGEILPASDIHTFFSANNFYTTAASRISRGTFDGAVTESDILRLCGKEKK
ncbi:MAG: energy-coupling factor ABC transporter ATP-binding protein [Clostridia bacterium]|nr:energy-coupling factor ABC transporter ATP-binding protein [Clostridia bacterium]